MTSRHTSAGLIRLHLRKLRPYVPGEQPAIKSLIKLNTNENPYPPSPRVLEATRAAVDSRLRLYPSPMADPLRERLASLHHCRKENIIVGNGSDELLAMAVRAFAEPTGTAISARLRSRSTVQFFSPSYSLYPVLAEIHGAAALAVPLEPDFSISPLPELRRAREWDFNAALSFVTTPNAPSGRGYATAQLDELCRAQNGVVLLDEAYVDFARENAMALALKHPNVLVARTFSKAYSLCFQRVGYCVGPVPLVEALQKIRDSYNVNGLGQVAALATLGDLAYYQNNWEKVIHTRERLTAELKGLEFEVFPSQTNFILVRPPGFAAEEWLRKLRDRKILVRWFSSPGISAFLRVTIGTDQEADALVKAAKSILGGK